MGVALAAGLLQGVMISCARAWPGGAYGFLLSMAVLAPTGLAGIVLAWAGRARGAGPLVWLWAAAAAALAGTAVVPLLAAAPEREDAEVASEFGAWLSNAAPGAFWWALALSFAAMMGWALVIARAMRGRP
ncbi:hypothetical protein L1I79_19425 [Strepomyces sp. STD 3.1]|nr:hypothetical protein [Streptomyces sp. STD 3.1]